MHEQEVNKYIDDIFTGKIPANREKVQGCKRYLETKSNPRYDYKPEMANKAINLIEKLFRHKQGETMEGVSLAGTPLLLQPWQKFIIFDLLSFYKAGTAMRKYRESFIFIPRKNGKSTFISALVFVLNLLYISSNPHTNIVANSLDQTEPTFDYIYNNIEPLKLEGIKLWNSQKIKAILYKGDSNHFQIRARSSDSKNKDGFQAYFNICDELHEYKNSKLYDTLKDGTKTNRNSLTLGITTAGDIPNGFCAQRLKYCQSILNKTVKDDSYHIYISKADEGKNGEVDYLDPIQHQKANPNYGISINPEEMMSDAAKAENDPQTRGTFLAKSLNVFVNNSKAYFEIDKFRESDEKYSWTLEDLQKLNIKWFGGCDLAKMHDLTATALVGNYQGVDIIITHAFFPRIKAHEKAERDNIPIFGWEEDGWLTLTDGETTNHTYVVNWFEEMRKKGFKIKQIGFDRKFSEEFYLQMTRKKFNVIEEPQLYINKSRGFRRIEQKMYEKKLYYLHSTAYEYCVENVKGILKTDDMIQYEKAFPNTRIDLFDASVFATCRLLSNLEKTQLTKSYLTGGKK